MENVIEGEVIKNEWFLAAIKGDVSFLKTNASDNIGKFGENNRTALMYASDSGHKDCVKFLSKFNVEIGKQDEDGNTALMYAAKKGNLSCIKILAPLESNICNKDGKKAIDFVRDFPKCYGFLSIYEVDTDTYDNVSTSDDSDTSDDSNSIRNLIKENKRLKNKHNVLDSANKMVDRTVDIKGKIR